MNIFALDYNPKLAAQYHCDKHVVKMILEYAQILSTAHRVLDGRLIMKESSSGKTIRKYYELSDKREDILYRATHINHPSCQWVRESTDNYEWLYRLFNALCKEYTYRYNKTHKTAGLLKQLKGKPKSLNYNKGFTPFKKAMQSQPVCLNIENPIEAYRAFYHTKPFNMKWSHRDVPSWFNYSFLPENHY